jgi:ABC-type iron transport system FetAB permease component
MTEITATDAGVPAPLAPADQWMRRLLRLPPDAPRATEASARALVERSLLISMVRCLLTYIVLPFVAPIFGFATGVTPAVGLVVGLVAIAANIASVRRFWRADHRYRWHYTALATVIVAALVWLVIADLVELLT